MLMQQQLKLHCENKTEINCKVPSTLRMRLYSEYAVYLPVMQQNNNTVTSDI